MLLGLERERRSWDGGDRWSAGRMAISVSGDVPSGWTWVGARGRRQSIKLGNLVKARGVLSALTFFYSMKLFQILNNLKGKKKKEIPPSPLLKVFSVQPVPITIALNSQLSCKHILG